MTTKCIISILLSMVFICCAAAHACTSFAVYTGEAPVYGMNMDFYDSDYTLFLVEPEGFRRGVMIGYTYHGNQFAHAAMMNDLGFFASLQDLHPQQPYRTLYEDGMVPSLPWA